jgi:cytochrome c-type biogenesis protein CcmH/NrfG
VACILVILPVTLRNFAITGEFVAVSAAGGENFYLAYGPYAKGYYARPPFLRAAPYQEHQDFRDEVFLRTGTPRSRGDCSRYWFKQGLASVLEQPGRALMLAWKKTLLLFNDFEFPDNENYPVSRELVAPLRWLPTFGCVVGLGLLGMARATLRLRRHLLPLGFTAVLALGVLLTFNIGRYRAAFIPMLLIFSGRAVVGLLTAVRRRSYASAAGTGLVALAFSFVAFLPAPGLAIASRDREFGIFRKGIAEAAAAFARIASLEASLKTNPTNPVLWITYGTTLEQTGRLPEAREAYLKAARVAPGLAEARFALARLFLRQGELDAAANEAHASIVLNPQHARSHLLLGRISLWEAAGAPGPQEAHRAVQEAAGHLHRAIEADRGLAEAYAKLGRAYFLLGAPQQALEILDAGRQIDPSSVESGYLRDFIRGRSGSTN